MYIVGISSLADAHRSLAPRVIEELKKEALDIPVILGGFIQPEDIPELKEKGISEVFGINTKLAGIVGRIENIALAKGGIR